MNSQNWNKFDEIHKQFEQIGGADGFIKAVKQEGLSGKFNLKKKSKLYSNAEELASAMETMREEVNKLGERNLLNLKTALKS
jgi:hypothetical protein